MTGPQLKGERRMILLLDGVPRELTYDFSAACVIEREFTMPLSKVVEEIRGGLERQAPKDEQGNLKDPETVQEQLERLLADEGVRLEVGTLETAGRWAYAMTETWREDNNERMTWKEFKKLLPVPPRHKAESQEWQAAVYAHMMAEYEAIAGNVPSGGSAESEPPQTGTPPTGDDSTTS